MSLLLEALKKAEQDKLSLDPARQTAGQAALSSLSEASAEETLPGYPPPASSGTLELMQKEPAPPQQHPDDSARQQSAHERKAAQNVFAAKQDGVGGVRAGKLLMVAGVVLITISGGAYYVWQEITRAPGIGVVSGPAPVLTPMAISSPASLPATPIPKEIAPPASPTAKDATPLRQAERSKEVEEENVTMTAPARARVESPPEPAIKLQRKQSANAIPPLLTAAYQAYLAGDLVSARQKYLQQLQHDPRNKDVLLGLYRTPITR